VPAKFKGAASPEARAAEELRRAVMPRDPGPPLSSGVVESSDISARLLVEAFLEEAPRSIMECPCAGCKHVMHFLDRLREVVP